MTRILIFSLLFSALALSLPAQENPDVQSFITQLQQKRYLRAKEATQIYNQQLSAYELFPAIYTVYREQSAPEVEKPKGRRGGAALPTRARLRILGEMVRKSGLIPREVCDTLNLRIARYGFTRDAYSDELTEVFRFLAEYSEQAQGLELTVALGYLDSLKSWGLVSHEGMQRAVQSPPQSPEEIIDFLDDALLISPSKLPLDPAKAYEIALGKMGDLRFDLRISDFTFEIEPPITEDQGYIIAKIGFACNGQRYLFYNNLSQKLGKKDHPGLGKQFYQIFNRILVENGSKYRLVSLGVGNERTEQILLLLLDKTQYEQLDRKEWAYNSYYFDPTWYKLFIEAGDRTFDILSTKEIERYLSKFEELGFYRHVHPEVLAFDKKSWRQSFLYSPWSLTYDTGFTLDWTSRTEPYTYDTLYTEILRISRGNFAPTDHLIIDEGDSSQLTFIFGEDTVFMRLPNPCISHADAWFPAFNQLFEEQEMEGRLFKGIIPNDGSYWARSPAFSQQVYCLFLTPRQQAYLLENELLIQAE